MFSLNPVPRRIVYVLCFELLAIVMSSLLLGLMTGAETESNLFVAVSTSLFAVVWNYTYNTVFDAWEARRGIRERSFALRIGHAIGFQTGFVLMVIPFLMWWFSVGFVAAFAMEATLLVFFFFYTFVFTWLFDMLVKKTAEA